MTHPDSPRAETLTNDELADRLEWWLAYFDDGTERHPDFADDPYGFDETAIEADLRASASRLREQDGERIRVSEDMLHFLRSSQNRVGSESPEILILHPQEPSNG